MGCEGKVKILIVYIGCECILVMDLKCDIEVVWCDYFVSMDCGMWNFVWWVDLIMFGKYLEEGLKVFEKDLFVIILVDMKLIF